MKEIAIMSGKGGTGKTSLCSSLVSIAREQKVMVCDCDVECPDLHLLIESDNCRLRLPVFPKSGD